MKNLLKGKVGTTIILLFTVVLAGVAIFTAIRLYQLRSQPVAPNVPSSIPHADTLAQQGEACGGSLAGAKTCAAGLTCVKPQGAPSDVEGTCQTSSGGSCSLSFALTTVTPTPTPTAPPTAVVCTNKTAYKDVTTNTAGNYNLSATNLLAANAIISVDQQIVYVINPGPNNVTKSITITDTLPTNVTFVDSVSTCTYVATTRKVTCTLANTDTQAAFRVSVNAGATGTITNTASVQGQGDTASTCSVSLTVPVPQCNDTCTSTAQCSSGLVCNIPDGATVGNCRNSSCTSSSSCVCATATPTVTPTPTPTSTPNSCNGTCGSNANCQDGMICSQGFCRNPSCTSSTSCNCPGGPTHTPTPTPTAPALPQSGTDWPTVAGFGMGILVIFGSLLLAL
ncbi:MAG TPA: hypothetical protein VL401_00775 [Alphaproteobacteria bacterium]|jgi:hypothetical protein|nr:hypothetical protein [Alphaproteobacteria bacterium]